MDPNDLLCMAWKWQRGDVTRHTGGDLAAALGHLGLFGVAPTFMKQVDRHLGELLAR